MSPELRDAGSDVAEAITGYDRERPHTRVELCESAIGHRQIVGWPLLAVGGVTLLGAMFIEPRATTPRHPEVLPGSAP